MLLDREQTGPKNITPRAVDAIKQILMNGFCPGTTVRNRERYERQYYRLGRLPSLEEIGGRVDLESGYISRGGMFAVVANEDKGDIEDALIKGITMGRGESYCDEHTLWSPQTLNYASKPLHIVRTTPEGKVNIVKVGEWSDDEEVVETIETKDIRRVAIRGTGYSIVKYGFVPDPHGIDLSHPVWTDAKLDGQEVLRVGIMGRLNSARITDALVINSENQLLPRTFGYRTSSIKA